MTACAWAACDRAATTVVDTWPMCRGHVREHYALERPARPRDNRTRDANTLQRIRALHARGRTDGEIAAAVHLTREAIGQIRRKVLGLPVNTRKTVRPHGTHAAYVRHRKADETPCEACKAAESAYHSQRYRARKEQAA